jgi:molybdopterin-dependent oxidoreductase alpha subunit
MRLKGKFGGGWPAVVYTLNKALEVGPVKLWKRMVSKNACKTCAIGMGGMQGGMVNEAGHFPEVCKKSLQAQVADMKGAVPADFFDLNDLSALKKLTPKQAEDAGRLTYPVILEKNGKHFQPVTWEKALSIVARGIKGSTGERTAFYASGRSSNEAAFVLQSFARSFGSNNVMNCSFYCHQASGVALKMTLGTSTATVDLDDLSKCDLVVLLGANPASNHPRLMTQLANLRKRGGQVIVVNPVVESGLERFYVPSQLKSLIFGSEIASLYVQPLAGGDIAFLVGVLKSLIEMNAVNSHFLSEHTENYQAVIETTRNKSWEELTKSSGVTRNTTDGVASLLASSKSCIFAWAMGLTHHAWGVDNILAVCNIALALGQVGKPGAGLLPIRGHSNVQGLGSIGFAPQIQDDFRKSLEKVYAKELSAKPGLDTYSMLEAAQLGAIDSLLCLGGNLWGSNPDSAWARAAMQKIKTITYLSTKLNPGHFHGTGETTIILPVLARDEEEQATTQESMFNYVRLSEGGMPNVAGGMKSETEVILTIADQVLGKEPVDWTKFRDHAEIRKLISQVIPGWQEIASIDSTKKEFTISGRIFHTPKFKTENGKAVMHVTPLPEVPAGLTLITLRSEGQFNTVVYEEADIYRGIPHRFCLLISQADATKLNLRDGQRITVCGEAGSIDNIELVIGNVRPGVVAMFYPESNAIIKPRIDKRSGTPSFKSAPVSIIA